MVFVVCLLQHCPVVCALQLYSEQTVSVLTCLSDTLYMVLMLTLS
jgi:hypothetical protein